MADVITHVLVGYTIGTIYDWLGPHHVTLVMIGALSSDFVKIGLVLPNEGVQTLLGIPLS